MEHISSWFLFILISYNFIKEYQLGTYQHLSTNLIFRLNMYVKITNRLRFGCPSPPASFVASLSPLPA